MSSFYGRLLVLLGLLLSFSVQAASTTIVVSKDVFREFRDLVNPNTLRQDYDFSLLKGKPDVAELVLLIQALQAGGFSDDITVKASENREEVLKMLASGEVALAGMSFWRSEVKSSKDLFWLSDALIRQGEYSLGIYTCGKSLTAQQLISGLPKYTGVFGGHEAVSLKTLQSVRVKRLLIMDDWSSVVDVLCNSGADFTFAPFPPTKSLLLPIGPRTLEPIQGIKVSVDGSRHFIVSKADGRGKLLYFMLQRGLRKMRVKGVITQAFEQSGAINSEVEHWQLVNP